jgi:hypothetical protein
MPQTPAACLRAEVGLMTQAVLLHTADGIGPRETRPNSSLLKQKKPGTLQIPETNSFRSAVIQELMWCYSCPISPALIQVPAWQ